VLAGAGKVATTRSLGRSVVWAFWAKRVAKRESWRVRSLVSWLERRESVYWISIRVRSMPFVVPSSLERCERWAVLGCVKRALRRLLGVRGLLVEDMVADFLKGSDVVVVE
jgi:hypothetical protein